MAALAAFFGLVAVLLACLGLYGVMANATARRTTEIGIRMALGATRGRVLGMVLGDSVWVVLAGLAVGVPGALGATRLIASRLFDVATFDPLTFGGASLLLVAVALLAASLPARRAARVDPMAALRVE